MAEFRLYPPQKRTLVSPATELLYGGAVAGGKSYLLRVVSIVLSIEVPGLITYLFRRTYKELLANHVYTPGGYLEMLADLIQAGQCVYNKSDASIAFRNGSRIQLAHCQYPGDVYMYQGSQIGLLLIDESTHFEPDMIRFLRSRVRLGSLTIPDKWKNLLPRILYASNPGGVGHHYFKSNFVDFGAGTIFKAPDEEGGMLREYVPAKLTDNKVLLANDPDYAARVKGMGDTATVTAMLTGDWDSLSDGGFAGHWKASAHVVEPFDIPVTWRIDRGYDYGSSAPAACLWFAESNGEEFLMADGEYGWVPKGTIFIIKECYLVNARYEGLRLSPEDQAMRFKNAERDEPWGRRVKAGPADSAIFSREPGRRSIADDMADVGMTFVRSDKSPGSRVRGVALMKGRLSAGTRRPMESPGIFIFRSCVHTIRTIPNLQNDDKNIEDIDTSGEDHIWDVIRYKLLHASKEISQGEIYGT